MAVKISQKGSKNAVDVIENLCRCTGYRPILKEGIQMCFMGLDLNVYNDDNDDEDKN